VLTPILEQALELAVLVLNILQAQELTMLVAVAEE
jgi:hypothetical protein